VALLVDGLLAFPVGRLIDRGHERAVMTAGSLILAAGLALHSQVNSLPMFYAVWAVLGVGMSATLYAPVFAVVTRRFPSDFRRAIITMTFLGGLASTVFIPLIAWLIAHLGWQNAVLVLAMLQLLVCAPLHFKWLNNAPKKIAVYSDFIKVEIENSPPPSGRSSSLAAHLTSAPYLLIGLFVVLFGMISVALAAHMVSLLREQGLSESWVLLVPASIGVIQVLGRLLLFFFEHRFDVHSANRLIPCLIPLALLALLSAPWVGGAQSAATAALLLLFVLLWGLGNGMITIVKGTAMAQYVSREHVASLNGALGLPLALARASAPLGLGLLWSAQSGYRHGLWLMLGMSLASVAALALAQRFAVRPSS
jgi:MFS family permease